MKASLGRLFLYVLIACLGFWNISSLVHCIHGDMTSGILPRYKILSEILALGELPFWDPYQRLGYPLHSSFIVSVWDPITLLAGKLFTFNTVTLHYFFLVFVVIGGFGFSDLLKRFKLSPQAILVCSICYMLSGVFVGNTMHLRFIMAITWLPWVLSYFLKLLNEPNMKNTLWFSSITAIFILEAYQKVILVTGYFLLLYLVYELYSKWKEKEYSQVRRMLGSLFASSFLLTLMILPLIISSIEGFSQMTRGDQMSYPLSQLGSMDPRGLLSFILPVLATSKLFMGEQAFLTLNNIYLGIIPLFILASSLIKPSFLKRNWKLLSIALVFLLLTLGENGGIALLAYKIIPLYGYFKLPGFLRVFVILIILILVAKEIENYPQKGKDETSSKIILGLFLLVFLSVFVYSVLKIETPIQNINIDLFFIDTLESLYQKLAIQSAIMFMILVTFYLAMKKNKRRAAFSIIVLDIMLGAAINSPRTSASPQASAIEVNKALSLMPSGFPIPNKPYLSDQKKEDTKAPLIWRNEGNFTKQPCYDGYNAYELKKYYDVINHPVLKDRLDSLPIVFLSSIVVPQTNYKNQDISTVVLDSMAYEILRETPFQATVGDTCYFTKFKPHEVAVAVKTSNPKMLTLMQINYPGWKAFDRNEEIPIYESYGGVRSVLVTNQTKEVVFKYSNNKLVYAFWLSVLTFVLIIIALFYLHFKHNKYQY